MSTLSAVPADVLFLMQDCLQCNYPWLETMISHCKPYVLENAPWTRELLWTPPQLVDVQKEITRRDKVRASNPFCVWVQSQWSMTESDLTMIFSHFGTVKRVDLPRTRGLPFAFIHFDNELDVQELLAKRVNGFIGLLFIQPYQAKY